MCNVYIYKYVHKNIKKVRALIEKMDYNYNVYNIYLYLSFSLSEPNN